LNRGISIKPFKNCPALDGFHCQTNSLAKIFHFYGHQLSEDMLLGLGAGIGFIYWHQKGMYPFVGARGNNKDFFSDIGKRTSVGIKVKSTSSQKKAEEELLKKMGDEEPAMLFGDMGMLPWFEMPEDYHFGGHTFTVCGYDGKETVLISDMDQKSGGLKKGFYSPVTLEQLKKARDSKYKPFPPKNTYLDFDFSGYTDPGTDEIFSAIKQNMEAMLEPPISNLGIKGIKKTAGEIKKWKKIFNDRELRLNLFTLYIFIEIGGTGGGSFRYMYSRFLEESAGITGNSSLLKASKMVYDSGKIFTEIGMLFKDSETVADIDDRIEKASSLYMEAADSEEKAFSNLMECIK
jgi:hypothetical protein